MTNIIFCVPGVWSNHQELVESIAKTDHFYAGTIMKSLNSEYSVELEEHEPDVERW